MYISVAQKLPSIWLETSKNSFWQKPDFVKINEFSLLKLKKCKNRKIDTFLFLAISLAILELQRRTIPHFNPQNNSFWPYEEQLCCRVNRFWVIRPNVSTIFFGTHFMYHECTYHAWQKDCDAHRTDGRKDRQTCQSKYILLTR